MESVLLIGGTRFSGLYLWKELHKRVSSQFTLEILNENSKLNENVDKKYQMSRVMKSRCSIEERRH